MHTQGGNAYIIMHCPTVITNIALVIIFKTFERLGVWFTEKDSTPMEHYSTNQNKAFNMPVVQYNTNVI